MDQPVLMHADVDEGAEGRDIGHDALEHHAGLEVRERFDALLERRGLECRARIAAGLLQLAQDVGDGRHAKAFVDEVGGLQACERLRIADHGVDVGLESRRECGAPPDRLPGGRRSDRAARRHRVMRRKPALCSKALAPSRGTSFSAARVREGPMRLAMDDDRLRQRLADARDARQQRGRGGVDVDADRVDAILDHRVERARRASARTGHAGTGRRRSTSGRS